MKGMSATTGRVLDGDAHLAQSIATILTTPIGSRVMRRDFGSELPDLIDAPANQRTRVRLFGAVATALQRWEPRIRATRIALERTETAGAFVLTIQAARRTGGTVNLTVPLSV